MPEIGVQTEMTVNTIEHLERHSCIHQILIQNGWKKNPTFYGDGLPFVMSKSFCESVFFHGFPNNYKFNNDEWELVQTTAKRFIDEGVYPNYNAPDVGDITRMVRDITISSLGLPIHIVELIYTPGMLTRNDINHFDIRVPLLENGQMRQASSIGIEEIGDMVYETHLQGREGYEHRDAILFKALHTGDGDFGTFRGVPLQNLTQRNLETFLHLNLQDEDVPVLHDELLLDDDTLVSIQTLQVFVDEFYEPPTETEDEDEDEEGEQEECG